MLSVCKSVKQRLFKDNKGVCCFEWIGKRNIKVVVLGAMTTAGQSLSLMLKQSGEFDQIELHDDSNATVLARNLNNLETPGRVTAVSATNGFEALKDANIVAMIGGHPCNGQPSEMTAKQFEANCKFVYDSSKLCFAACPNATVCVVTAPVNSTLPIASAPYRNRKGLWKKIIGVNNIVSMRACRLLSEFFSMNPKHVNVPIVGGCSFRTSVPIFSHAVPNRRLTLKPLIQLTKEFQETEAADADPQSSVAADFIVALAKSINGYTIPDENLESGFLPAKGYPSFVNTHFTLGKYGVNTVIDVPYSMNSYERAMVHSSFISLQQEIDKGLEMLQQFTDAEKTKNCDINA